MVIVSFTVNYMSHEFFQLMWTNINFTNRRMFVCVCVCLNVYDERVRTCVWNITNESAIQVLFVLRAICKITLELCKEWTKKCVQEMWFWVDYDEVAIRNCAARIAMRAHFQDGTSNVQNWKRSVILNKKNRDNPMRMAYGKGRKSNA